MLSNEKTTSIKIIIETNKVSNKYNAEVLKTIHDLISNAQNEDDNLDIKVPSSCFQRT